ncbi:hypothetical protein CRV02_08340 [Arcobacter sp. CECT 8989]|uniref:hypothetical protein n=1 Tax=Arcobacter sp. CECT 8989 TaxID=2044509 RepID=UPI00100B1B43|nr:hypothetical protein [Arcobacter sp. CECT 8989]RXK01508.1 hypothetical protein CRV02_08340 [Arcobacter sp. CECT 8989]
MWASILTNFVLPLAVDTVKKYIDSTESKKDDKVLEVVQSGAKYLANKGNNTITLDLSKELDKKEMVFTQKPK